MARRFFTPVLLSAVADSANGTISVHVTSDLKETIDGKLLWTAFNPKGEMVVCGEEEVDILPRRSRLVRTISAKRYLKEGGRDLLFWLNLLVNGQSISSDGVAFVRPKHIGLCEPRIESEINIKNGRPIITLTSKAPALWVWVDMQSLDARFSDNFFHLMPGEEANVTIFTKEPVPLARIRKNLRVRSQHVGVQSARGCH
jgi:beta-mannosidase